MHNRARLITAAFLTKHLGLDWRDGVRWFFRWLLDGDVPNNSGNWQWVAGTGNDTKPYRRFNPIRQAERFDPDGVYVRRYVPELNPSRARPCTSRGGCRSTSGPVWTTPVRWSRTATRQSGCVRSFPSGTPAGKRVLPTRCVRPYGRQGPRLLSR